MPEVTLSAPHLRKFSKNPVIAFYQSSIGKKIVVGVTALFLILYVLGHLIGNLQIYMGQNQINAYAKLLHDLGPILWIVRFVLLAAFVTHIVATIQLAQENRLAKPQRYAPIEEPNVSFMFNVQSQHRVHRHKIFSPSQPDC